MCVHLLSTSLYYCFNRQHFVINAAPKDYTSVNASFIFVTGTSQGGPGSQMCVEVPIANDALVEFDEFFQVTADSPDPNINTSLILAAVFVLDDDSEHS